MRVDEANCGAPPTCDPLIKERVRRALRQSLFAIAAAPVTIGRFVVLDRIGVGGMATVYVAYDPQLERKVALKVIASDDDSEAERLVREAKTMARLSHPHVATVYDAGVFDNRVVIAMEFAAAGTLRDWLDESRTSAEIIDMFSQAARGLSAAHEAGIVHRDFKPENVLVADDGRALVTDFGIAQPAGSSAAIIGTPRYMAPEQRRGSAVDARTDQFSWSVCLFEALYRQHPFAGETDEEIAKAMVAGLRRSRAKRRGRAGLVAPPLERGLCSDVAGRYANLTDLLEAIDRRLAFRRRWQLGVAGLILAVCATAVWALWTTSRPAPISCEESRYELDEVWAADRAEILKRAFKSSASPSAEATFESLKRNIDAHAEAWRTMRIEACEATHVRGSQSKRWLDLRTNCLDARRNELDALIGVLADSDQQVLENAHSTLAKLTPLTVCDDPAALNAMSRRLGGGATIRRLERRLDSAEAEMRAGRYQRGLDIADAVARQARPLGYSLLLARALHLRGLLRSRVGSTTTGIDDLYEAGRVAASAHADWRAAEISIDLIYQVVYVQGQPRQLEPLRHVAEAAVARVGRSPRLLVTLHRTLGIVNRHSGDYEASLWHHRRALEAAERLPEGEYADLSATFNGIANTHRDKGDYSSAFDYYQRSLDLRRKHLGGAHPATAHTLNNMAIVYEERGQFAQATAYYEEARTIFTRSLGEGHPHVAMTLNNLANTLRQQGETEAAIPLLERSAEIFARTRGENHPHVAWPLNTLGLTLTAAGQLERAYAVLNRSRRIRVDRFGDDHPLVAMVETSLGQAYLQGERVREAIAVLESALAIRRADKVAAGLLAETAFPLARALWRDEKTRPRSIALAREAQRLVEESGLPATGELATIEGWLAARDGLAAP